MSRLRERFVAAAAAEGRPVEAARVTEAQLLAWHDPAEAAAAARGGGTGSSGGGEEGHLLSGSGGGGGDPLVAPPLFVTRASSAAPGLASASSLGVASLSLTASGAGRGVLSGANPGSRLAPLSGLVPPPLQSRLVPHTGETPGEQLLLRCGRPAARSVGRRLLPSLLAALLAVACVYGACCRSLTRPPLSSTRSHAASLSAVLLSCLPGFWAAAASPRLADAPDLPPAMRTKLRTSIKGVAATAQKLVRGGRGGGAGAVAAAKSGQRTAFGLELLLVRAANANLCAPRVAAPASS